MSVLEIPTAEVFEPLLVPARYKGAHGGRGSGKSHFFAENLVELAVEWPHLVHESEPIKGLSAVCIREVQKSLNQSAKRTIEGKIRALGVGHLFDVQRDQIKTPGGGLIIFQGMQNHTAETIKSLEGYQVAWVEEAQTLSANSLRILRPTIRKKTLMRDGSRRLSELWFSWNPKNPTDPVDALLRGNDPNEKDWKLPPHSVVVEANYQDNPWFHETGMDLEVEYDRGRDLDMFGHVWGGQYEKNSQARVFKRWRVEEFDPPKPGTILYAGADWGFSNDPSVLVVVFIEGRKLYVWRAAWQIGCEIDQTPQLFDRVDPAWTPQRARDPIWRSLARRLPIIADSARPETISAMRNAGFSRIQPAIKGPGSIEDGVAFLKSYDIIVHPNCEGDDGTGGHVAKELAAYSFKIDPHTGEVTNVLEDDKNHTIDSLRYAVENVRRAGTVTVSEL